MLKLTEEPSLYSNLEQQSVHTLLTDINTEDKKVAAAVEKAIPQIEVLVCQLVVRMRAGGRLFYIGAGTSGRLGVLDASELPPTYGVPPGLVTGLIAGGDKALRTAVEHAEDDEEQGWKDLLGNGLTAKDSVIGIAASGTTPYVVGAVSHATEKGCLTGCITSNPGTPLAAVCQYPIEVTLGPEFVTGSSRMKSGTAQKMILNMISTTTMIRLGRVKGNRMVDMELNNNKLIDRGTRMVADSLNLPYDEARKLLLQYGSVNAVLSRRHSPEDNC